jgi:hypothetical protein
VCVVSCAQVVVGDEWERKNVPSGLEWGGCEVE